MSKKKILIPVIIFTAVIVILLFVLNSNHKYNKLSVSQNKWNSIQNSRIESNNLKLESIEFNDYKVIIDEKESALYYSVLNNSKNRYNPNVEYSTNNKGVKLVVLADEITDEKVKNNYQFKLMIYSEKEYHVYNLKCTDLPIMNISYNEKDLMKQKVVPVEMYLFDNLSNIPNKITTSKGKLKIENNSYLLSLQMLTPGKNRRENRLSILNMKPNSEYVLTKENNEPNKGNHIIELFINNEYKGVYSVKVAGPL